MQYAGLSCSWLIEGLKQRTQLFSFTPSVHPCSSTVAMHSSSRERNIMSLASRV